MKVVLFCGGQGTRIRNDKDDVPKPMVCIGQRPIIWHLMKYYAFFGHTEFVLCLGFRSESIKSYFLNYQEWLSNDFVLTSGGREVRLLNRDIDDWKITFVDTGMYTSIGQRLRAVRSELDTDEMFLANYSDGLTDLWLPDYLDTFTAQRSIGSFLAVQSTQSFHVTTVGADGLVTGIDPLSESGMWINGGFFVFRNEIFDYIREGEDLVNEPFQRLIRERRLSAHRYRGFWTAMDTFKDKRALEDLYLQGAPWEVWKHGVVPPVGVAPAVGSAPTIPVSV